MSLILYSIIPLTILCTCTFLTHQLPRRFTDSSSIARIRAITTLLVAAATVAMATVLAYVNVLFCKILGISWASLWTPLTLAETLLISFNLIILYNFWARWVAIPIRDFGQISYGILQARKKALRRKVSKLDTRQEPLPVERPPFELDR